MCSVLCSEGQSAHVSRPSRRVPPCSRGSCATLPEEWRARREDSVLPVLCVRVCPEEQRTHSPARRYGDESGATSQKKHLVDSTRFHTQLPAHGTFLEEPFGSSRLLSQTTRAAS